MPAPTITALPTPPSTSDPTNFDTRSDAFLAALPDFVTECNALASYLETTGIANAATLGGKTWASPDPIGTGTPAAATVTTLTAGNNVVFTSGALFAAGQVGLSYRNTNSALYLQMPTGGLLVTDSSLNTKLEAFTAGVSGGLAVTGTLSATGTITTGSTAGGTLAGSRNTTTGDILTITGNNTQPFSDFARIRIVADNTGGGSQAGSIHFDTTASATLNTDRMVLDSTGTLLVGTTTVHGGAKLVSESGAAPAAAFNRQTDDGTVVMILQAGTEEGSISVSGTTVSYNAFLGSHWSQQEDGGRAPILRGTVIESVDAMCMWPGEGNDRLPRSKVSDTTSGPAVYGVFLGWDDDWTRSNDYLVASIGAGYIRMQSGQSPVRGDLVVSAGDGTAKVKAAPNLPNPGDYADWQSFGQALRDAVAQQFTLTVDSSVIGKITSATVQETHDDGSFVLPCVLYAG